jgi:hypothetical protein
MNDLFSIALAHLITHIDGRPYFAKLSFGDVEQVKIAGIDPDFYQGRSLCP